MKRTTPSRWRQPRSHARRRPGRVGRSDHRHARRRHARRHGQAGLHLTVAPETTRWPATAARTSSSASAATTPLSGDAGATPCGAGRATTRSKAARARRALCRLGSRYARGGPRATVSTRARTTACPTSSTAAMAATVRSSAWATSPSTASGCGCSLLAIPRRLPARNSWRRRSHGLRQTRLHPRARRRRHGFRARRRGLPLRPEGQGLAQRATTAPTGSGVAPRTTSSTGVRGQTGCGAAAAPTSSSARKGTTVSLQQPTTGWSTPSTAASTRTIATAP